MAKEAPTLTVALDDSGGTVRQIENDVTNLDWGHPRGVQDVTGVNKGSIERLLLLGDFSVTLNGVFNDAAAPSSFDCLKTVASADVARTLTLVMSGQTLANEIWVTDYQNTRGQDGSLTWSAPGVLQDGTDPTWS